MQNPLVSVIIPVGPNHSKHCRTAAASVAWQSLSHICETILIEDGGAQVPNMPGCVVLRGDGERRGPAHTRNKGIAVAKGQFILPLDADDYLLPNSVASLLREYARGAHGYVYADAYTQERDGTFVLRGAPNYDQKHLRVYNPHVVTALIPTKHARAVGGYDEGVDAWEDWSFHLRLAIAGVCGYRLPIPIFTYRVYEGERMTRFYGGDRALMEAVQRRYTNQEGRIDMASCCGGDAGLAAIAAQAVLGAPQGGARPMEGGMVRVEFLGEERGTQTWEPTRGRLIRLGNNAMARYADVTEDEAAWLAERAQIRVVPNFDNPDAPAPLEPVLQEQHVLTPDATTKALRPRGRAVVHA